MQYQTYQQIIETARREHAGLVAWFDRPSFWDAPASVRSSAMARAYQLEKLVIEISQTASDDGGRQDSSVKCPHGNHGDNNNG